MELHGGDAGAGALWRFAGHELDEAAQQLRVAGNVVELERKPFDLLLCLLQRAGEVVTKDELLDAVWPGRVVVDGVLSVAVSKLRQALNDAGQQIVATVHGYGYRLAVPVEKLGARSLPPPTVALQPGTAVPGRESWTLQRRLGEHGDVWLALQAKTREPRVFKFSADGARLTALKREATLSRVLRDVLGERPDFVRVLEWNFEQAPFFLECEYGGENLLEWAQAQGGLETLALEQRLELLAAMAEAVHAAHSAGVLHKDLKPANVLVGRSTEGHWQVRLTDFGSGRLMDAGRLADLGITRLGFTQTQLETDSSGTPLYLAPEVIGGRSPSAQSDIYALGVMLYQIAVGDLRRPLAPGWEAQIADELLREDIAAAAHGTPEGRLAAASELAERLRARKDRRRARDAEHAALERARLAEENLLRLRARRPWLYGSMALLVGGLVVALWLYRDAAQARNLALEKTEVAGSVTKFLTQEIVAFASPVRGGSAEIPLKEALIRAEQRVPELFGHLPQSEAEIRSALGYAFDTLGSRKRATAQWQRAVDLLRQTEGEGSERYLQALLSLIELQSKVDPSAARPRLQEAEAAVAALKQPQPLTQLRLQRAHFSLSFADRDWPAAERYLQEVMARQNQDPQRPAVMKFNARRDLAHIHLQQGRLDQAEQELQQLSEETAALGASGEALWTMVRADLASVYIGQGRHDEAVAVLEAVVPVSDRVFGAGHSMNQTARNALGQAYMGRKRYAEAEPIFAQLHRQLEQSEGFDSASSLIVLNNWAIALRRTGRLAESQPVLRNVAERVMAQAAQRPPHVAFHLMLSTLVDQSLLRGDLPTTTRAWALLEPEKFSAFIANELSSSATLAFLGGEVAYARGDFKTARTELTRAVELLLKKDPADDRRQRAEAHLRQLPAT